MKPFKAWILYDSIGTYYPMLHPTRRDAVEDKKRNDYLIDAQWIIRRVSVRRVSTPASREEK